jgi:hypothetical protein
VGKKKNDNLEIKTYEAFVHIAWSNIFSTLKEKLSFGDEELIELYVKVTVDGKNPNGKVLDFRSPNWTN